MEQKPPTIESEPILTFEEFRKPDSIGIPHYNNFYFHFSSGSGFIESIYKEQKPYKRFEREHTDMTVSLCTKIQNMDNSVTISESLKSCEAELYEAYKIMRGYGASDQELFA